MPAPAAKAAPCRRTGPEPPAPLQRGTLALGLPQSMRLTKKKKRQLRLEDAVIHVKGTSAHHREQGCCTEPAAFGNTKPAEQLGRKIPGQIVS